MTNRFDMEGFIPTVVAEEEKRHQLQDEDEEEDEDDLMSDYTEPSLGLIGTGRAQQTRRFEALRRRQQQTARRKQLESVAPRLEILRNMPFFIPFHTRVQIFREFIYRDQMRRRQGFIDADAWRLSVAQASMGRVIDGQPAAQDILSRHHADIKRDSVFDDAFENFYELGEGLKEPIQITFIDKFNTVEAGIDGGGVTKEFLTSVTNEAFKTNNELHLFEENEQHLLYPNPAAVEQRKEVLRQGGYVERSAGWNDQVRDLLRRYEFLGRVIGKCLYEGILVDVNFAPFFLLKWALTGGMGSAQKETAYRANLNDLKDLDQRLYQGLVSFSDSICRIQANLFRLAAIEELHGGRGRFLSELHRHGYHPPPRFYQSHDHAGPEEQWIRDRCNQPKPPGIHILHCAVPSPGAAGTANQRVLAGAGTDHPAVVAVHVQSVGAADPG